MKCNWLTTYDYAESMKAGAKFPPITVALYKRGYYLVDGRHRLEATKSNKEKYIDAEVKKGLSAKEIYLLAVKMNIGHGRQFSVQEKANIILKLKDMNYNISQISQIVSIPLTSIQSFMTNRITNTISGKQVILKAPIKKLKDQPVEENINYEQDMFSASSQIQIIEQLIRLIENNWLDIENEQILNKLEKLSNLLESIKVVQR